MLTARSVKIEVIVPEELLDRVSISNTPGTATRRRCRKGPSQRGEQVEKMTRSFKYNLIALTFIALMVGMFLIYNTMTISVIRRRPEIGTLRALGVSRFQIMSLFMISNPYGFGIVGTTIGLLMGVAMSQGALKAIAGNVPAFLLSGLRWSRCRWQPQVLIGAFCLGVFLTMVASLPPVIEATGVAPAEATRRASYRIENRFDSPRLFSLLGAIFFIGAVAASGQQPVYNFPIFGYVAALAAILGSALVMPLALRSTLPLLGAMLRKVFGLRGFVRCSISFMAR